MVNPFAHIADPVTQIQLNEGDAQDLFSVPENISDYVTVEYSSENSDVATYADGRVNAVAAGKTIVTVTVTSNYDGFVMEYSTAVEVVGSSVPEAGEVTDTTDPADNTGNASLVGDASSLADAFLTSRQGSCSSRRRRTDLSDSQRYYRNCIRQRQSACRSDQGRHRSRYVP